MKAFLLLAASAALCQGQGQGLDSTLTPGAFGRDVVEAVVDRIRFGCVYPEDRLFLRRVANVMSRDGEDSATYRPGFHGGIWQVNETIFEATKPCNNSFVQSACASITSSLNIDWSTVTWSDLRQPLYSGVAAALFTLQSLEGEAMPGNLTGQADLWGKMYSGQPGTFTDIADMGQAIGCTSKLDMVFLLDSSGSIDQSDFTLMLQFAANVAGDMAITQGVVRVGVITFSTKVTVQFHLDAYHTTADTSSAILNIAKISSGTNTHLGLQEAATMVHGGSGARPDAKKVVVLVTDGRSREFSLTRQAGKQLKELGTTVFAVGVGNYNLEELRAVASDPVCAHVMTLTSFSHIQSILHAIQSSACEANYQLTKENELTGVLGETKTKISVESKVPVDNETIVATVSCGILSIFVSTTDPRPSAAVHDDRYMATPDRPALLTLIETLPSGTPVFVTVVGERLPESAARLRQCSDYTWSLGVVPITDKKPTDMDSGSGDDLPIDNPCTMDNLKKHVLRQPYVYDPTKFVQCDLLGGYTVEQCPDGVPFNAETRTCGFVDRGSSGPSGPNPCTMQDIQSDRLLHAHQTDDTKYIRCDKWGEGHVETCGNSQVWSQSDTACVTSGAGSTLAPPTRLGVCSIAMATTLLTLCVFTRNA